MEKIYICPMHLQIQQNSPGFCPICGMDLEPKILDEKDEGLKEMSLRFWLSLIFTLPLFILSMSGFQAKIWIEALLALPVVTYCAYPFYKRAILSKSLNMFTLISIGVVASFAYGIVVLFSEDKTKGVYFEAGAVITTLVLLGQMLELKGRKKTQLAIRALMALSPDKAVRVQNGQEVEVFLNEVQKGDLLRVKPGSKVPLDGIIIEGASNIDESMITGEWKPVDKEVGQLVIGGTLNGPGSFLMRVEKIGDETLLAQIIAQVEIAQRSRVPIQELADKVSGYFVPIVIFIAIVTLLTAGFMNAISVLIIACPCALGLATPMSIMVGMGVAAKMGVLIKEAKVLQAFTKVTAIAIDKTGTLTEGKPSVQKIYTFNEISEEDLLCLGASVEQLSEHPLSKAIVEEAKLRNLSLKKVQDFKAIIGKGVLGVVDGKTITIGSRRFFDAPPVISELGTAIYLAIDNSIMGAFLLSDTIKKEAYAAVKKLHDEHLEVIMLTGDASKYANEIGKELKIDRIYAEILPEEKEKVIQELKKNNQVVAMAGDGINDAPALAAADVGIAMGTGTDVALASADIVLVKGDLFGLIRARKISVAMMRNIKQNLTFAFIYNIIGIPIAAGVFEPFGIALNPMIASAAMTLSSLCVIGNALRLNYSTYAAA